MNKGEAIVFYNLIMKLHPTFPYFSGQKQVILSSTIKQRTLHAGTNSRRWRLQGHLRNLLKTLTSGNLILELLRPQLYQEPFSLFQFLTNSCNALYPTNMSAIYVYIFLHNQIQFHLHSINVPDLHAFIFPRQK